MEGKLWIHAHNVIGSLSRLHPHSQDCPGMQKLTCNCNVIEKYCQLFSIYFVQNYYQNCGEMNQPNIRPTKGNSLRQANRRFFYYRHEVNNFTQNIPIRILIDEALCVHLYDKSMCDQSKMHAATSRMVCMSETRCRKGSARTVKGSLVCLSFFEM